MSRQILYDCETGEIIREFNEPISRIYTESQIKKMRAYYSKKEKRLEMAQFNAEQGGFVFGIYEIEKEYQAELSQQDIARLMMIATYLDYQGYLAHSNGKMIGKSELKKILGLSAKAFYDLYGRLIQLDVLVEEGEEIRINQRYFVKGQLDSNEVQKKGLQYTRIYINGVRELYKACKSSQHKHLGVIFKLIPFIHQTLNIVCHNPDEKDVYNVKPMTLGEFSKVIGYGSDNVSRLKKELRAFEVGGMKAFQFVESDADNRTRKIIVNPKIFYAGNDYEDVKGILALFNGK